MANLKCGKCGKATSDLATRCPYCSTAIDQRQLPTVRLPWYMIAMPYVLIAYMGILGVPAAAGALGRYNAAVEVQRVADERAAEEARLQAHAEQLRLRRADRDSVLTSLPARKFRRVSEPVLLQALAIASYPTEDTVAKAWVFLAQKELSRREEVKRQNAAREE